MLAGAVTIVHNAGRFVTMSNRTRYNAGNIFILSLGLLVFAGALTAQQQPLITQPVEVVLPGTLQVSFGVEFLQNAEFPHSGLGGDLTRAGVVNLHWGISNAVELQLQGVVQNFLTVESVQPALITPVLDPGGTSTSDVGDFTLAVKVHLLREKKKRPAFGIRFGFEMPNTDEGRGLGLDTTNVFFSFLTQKHIRKLNLFSNLGVGILEAPGASFTQNDVVLYGIGGTYPVGSKVNLVAEVNGRWSTRDIPLISELIGTGSRSQARLGFQVFAGGLRFDVAGIAGLTDRDADSGIVFGVTRIFRLGGEEYPR